MRIVFHGANAATFSEGFEALLPPGCTVTVLPDDLAAGPDRAAYEAAEIIIGNRFDAGLPRPAALRLYHLPAAGYDRIDFAALPPNVPVCNCFGHEQAIAEYVMAALLTRAVPLADADRRLRTGDWAYWAGAPERVHPELGDSTLGILGFGHIGKAVAARAKAFGLKIHVANRSPVPPSSLVDRAVPLTELASFWPAVDAIVVTLPLLPETTGLVGPVAFATMRPHATLINVARGPVVDEQALFDALSTNRIGAAVIDTWYRYPTPENPNPTPSALPFETLPTLTMTPHMSGWTRGTIRRRQSTIAQNIHHLTRGETLENRVS